MHMLSFRTTPINQWPAGCTDHSPHGEKVQSVGTQRLSQGLTGYVLISCGYMRSESRLPRRTGFSVRLCPGLAADHDIILQYDSMNCNGGMQLVILVIQARLQSTWARGTKTCVRIVRHLRVIRQSRATLPTPNFSARLT